VTPRYFVVLPKFKHQASNIKHQATRNAAARLGDLLATSAEMRRLWAVDLAEPEVVG
jgi:hypothetical protein